MNSLAARRMPRPPVCARRFAAALLVLGWVFAGTAALGQSDARLLATRVDGPITPVIAAHVADALDAAERGGYAALLVEMDTPGGLDTAMRAIVQDLLRADVPVIVHVAPSGARAASAGAVIALAAHVVAMAPGTNIGAATPIALEGGEVIDKVIEDAAAYVRAVSEARGRDPQFAIDAVRDGRSVPAAEALEIGVADLVAVSQAELLAALDGRTVTLDPLGEVREDGSVVEREGFEPRTAVLRTAGAAVDAFEMSTTRRLLQALADPNLAFLFLSIGTLALLYELASPGGGLGGILGAIMLILAFFSLAVLPVDIVGILLVILAAALFVAELFMPGVGVFAGGGALALLLAGLFLFQRPTGIGVDLAAVVPIVALVGLGAAAVGRLAWRTRNAPTYGGIAGTMVGEIGTVREVRLEDPTQGRAFVDGALWKVRAAAPLEVGMAVRVRELDGLTLVVEPHEPA